MPLGRVLAAEQTGGETEPTSAREHQNAYLVLAEWQAMGPHFSVTHFSHKNQRAWSSCSSHYTDETGALDAKVPKGMTITENKFPLINTQQALNNCFGLVFSEGLCCPLVPVAAEGARSQGAPSPQGQREAMPPQTLQGFSLPHN